MSVIPDHGQEDREIGVSWSRLREHEECKQKAHQKDEGRKSPLADIRTYFPGTVVDRCMRHWLDAAGQPPGGRVTMLDQIMENEEITAKATGDGLVKWKYPGDKAEVLEWCRELLTRLEVILARVALPYWYQPAIRFRVPLVVPYLDQTPQRIWLAGELDLFVRSGEAADSPYAIWDLKGTNNTDYWRKVVGQLVFYGVAMAAKTGRWPAGAGLIQPMCPEQVLPFQFSEQQYAEMISRIHRYCHAVWRKDFTPKANEDGCGWCEVRHACVKYAAPPGRVPWPVLAA